MSKIDKRVVGINVLLIILSYLLTLGVFGFYKIDFSNKEIIFLVVVYAVFKLMKMLPEVHNAKHIVAVSVFSGLLSASFVIGSKITILEEPYIKAVGAIDFVYWIALSVVIFVVLCNIIKFLYNRSITVNRIEDPNIRVWVISAGILFIAWIPYFLMYFPGILTPDSIDSIDQSMGVVALKNYHPVMFTLFVKLILKIGLIFGDLNFAVGLFSIVQMIIMATIFGYSVYWLSKRINNKAVLIAVLLFYAINPVIAMYSITMWKDIIFNGLVLLLFLFLIDVVYTRGESLLSARGLGCFSLLGVLIAFTRNNGILVVLTTIILLGVYLRAHLKKLVPVFLGMLVFITVIQGPVYSVFNIAKSPASETLGIPLQQVAFAAKYGGEFTEEQEEFLNKVIPLETMTDVYRPHIVNQIKFNDEFDKEFFDENKYEFLSIWAQALPDNFSQYTKAHLMQTLGYYHIGTSNWICRFGISHNSHGLYSVDLIESATNVNLKGGVSGLISSVNNIPVIGNVFSIAFWIWLTLFCCIVLCIKKRRVFILPLIPLISIWASLLIGTPAFCEFRYMLSFHYALPFIILLFFIKNNRVAPLEQ